MARVGRKLARPVLHCSLSWARNETPTRQEMSRAVNGEPRIAGAGGPRGADSRTRRHPPSPCPCDRNHRRSGDRERRRSWTTASFGCRAGPRAEGYEREQGRIRVERRVKNNERGWAGEEVLRPIWDRPLHWARFRREGMLPKRARRARQPGDEERVDITAWRRAEARLWEQVEDRRWLGFWRLETRARK